MRGNRDSLRVTRGRSPASTVFVSGGHRRPAGPRHQSYFSEVSGVTAVLNLGRRVRSRPDRVSGPGGFFVQDQNIFGAFEAYRSMPPANVGRDFGPEGGSRLSLLTFDRTKCVRSARACRFTCTEASTYPPDRIPPMPRPKAAIRSHGCGAFFRGLMAHQPTLNDELLKQLRPRQFHEVIPLITLKPPRGGGRCPSTATG